MIMFVADVLFEFFEIKKAAGLIDEDKSASIPAPWAVVAKVQPFDEQNSKEVIGRPLAISQAVQEVQL